MSVPPPMHQPCTAATVGLRQYQSFMYTSTKLPIPAMSCTVSHTRPESRSAACASVDQSSP